MKSVVVIGAGPAGMMAAISAAAAGAGVLLIEKNEKAGKKLYITGKGRCNLTNACDVQDFFDSIVSNPRFAYSAIYSFSNQDTINFFEAEGLPLKTERGNRVFPVSDKASDVTKTLERKMRQCKVKVMLRAEVKKIAKNEEGGFLLEVKTSEGKKYLKADSVILAAGGVSYPSTGSTGDGYKFASSFGHSIIKPVPSLVPLTVREGFVKELEGLSLRNVSVALNGQGPKPLFSGFGEMLFTSRGVSGPLILSASCTASGKLAAGERELILSIDLKPALSEKQLDERILRDLNENKNRIFKNSLSKLLPAKMIPVVVARSGIDPVKKVNEITKAERAMLVRLLKGFTLTVTGTEGFSQAVITQGGVNVKEIDPGTMQSKLVPGLFFAGEMIDMDAVTGGFNIQLALSTGHLAGKSAAEL